MPGFLSLLKLDERKVGDQRHDRMIRDCADRDHLCSFGITEALGAVIAGGLTSGLGVGAGLAGGIGTGLAGAGLGAASGAVLSGIEGKPIGPGILILAL